MKHFFFAASIRKNPLGTSRIVLALFTLFLSTLTLIAAGQVRNGGLERWQMGTFQRPDSFSTIKVGTSPGSLTRTSSAHSGQYAALITTAITASGTQAGSLYYGIFDTVAFAFKGWPVSGRPARLSFWYKYSSPGNDTAVGAVILTKWKNGARTQVGQGYILITSNVSVYTQALVPISSSEQPDSALIVFGSSNIIATVGTTLHIDDISLDNATGIEEQSVAQLLRLYPNPTGAIITIDMPEEKNAVVEIIDIAGNNLFHEQASGQKLKIDCRNWPSGTYFVIVRTSERIHRGKFVRQ